LLKITAAFVTSAAGTFAFPGDGLPEVALVGRSNVGKSSLINALGRQQVARTSAAPGKTRLANIYRMARGRVGPLYLVDLPGYGYTRSRRSGFDELVQAAFARAPAALLLVDARHPGLDLDRQAWEWIRTAAPGAAIVATKIDKLARAGQVRARRELERIFQAPVLPVSAVTGEGLDELWKLIDRVANSRSSRAHSRNSSAPKATAPRPRRNSSASTWRRSRT
jgi:GTP-binding protein